jgi:hypothetical protein
MCDVSTFFFQTDRSMKSNSLPRGGFYTSEVRRPVCRPIYSFCKFLLFCNYFPRQTVSSVRSLSKLNLTLHYHDFTDGGDPWIWSVPNSEYNEKQCTIDKGWSPSSLWATSDTGLLFCYELYKLSQNLINSLTWSKQRTWDTEEIQYESEVVLHHYLYADCLASV